jgi:hypothetical protein
VPGADRFRGRTLAIVAVAVVALGVAAWALARGDDAPSEHLRALQDDPMGEYEPQGGRLVRTIARSEKSTGTITKATPAKYTRLFSLSQATARGALRDAITAARAAGWRLESAGRGLAATGEKQLPTGPGFLTISLQEDAGLLPDDFEPPVLSIGLEHGSA